jgi:protein involved in polysaccharide export with SLBB domain
MKELKRITGCLAAVLGIVGVGLVLTGCQTQPVFADFPEPTPAVNGTDSKPAKATTPYVRPVQGLPADDLIIGDVVTINFNSGDQVTLPAHSEAIKDDGRITPPYVGSIMARGKSPGQLQDELQKLYNKFYVNMTVTVSAKDRYYTVSGDVKSPGTRPYLGATTVLSAISAASDFTDFAKKTQVRINHANGKTEVVDCTKAIEDPKLDVPIYPGDKIFVPRRFF